MKNSNTTSLPRRVLMLVSAFPPGAQCIFRTLKFAKYLPEFGWEPIILTPRQAKIRSKKQSDTAPSGIRVARTGRFSTLSMQIATWRTLLKSSLKREANEPVSDVEKDVKSTESAPRNVGHNAERVENLLRRVLLWGDTPDNFAGWIPIALKHGKSLVRRHEIAAIHASGPPFSVVLSGALLSRLTGLPLIADFRDTWTLDPSDPFGAARGSFRNVGQSQRDNLIAILESWCLQQASAVLFTSQATMELYQQNFPFVKECCHLIANGVDLDDLPSHITEPLTRPTFAHVGTVHPYQWPQVRAFLEAFKVARQKGLIPIDTQVAFIGPLGGVQDEMQQIINELGLQNCVLTTGSLPHRDAVSWMQKCHVALLFVADNPYIRLSKLSELVVTGRPLFAFSSSDSQTGREVLNNKGIVIDDPMNGDLPQQIAQILQRGLETSFDNSKNAIAHPHPLNRRTNAMQLAQILDTLTQESHLKQNSKEAL